MDYENAWKDLKAKIESNYEFYKSGIMCTMSESACGQAMMKDLLNDMKKLEYKYNPMPTTKTKNIYMACSCSKEDRELFVGVAKALREEGYNVFVPFDLKIDEKDENGNWKYSQEDWGTLVADKDLAMINLYDTLLLLSDGRISSAGKNFEQGFAYAKGKRIITLQYTDDDTSLMTYRGSNTFKNVPRICLASAAVAAVKGVDEKGKCETRIT